MKNFKQTNTIDKLRNFFLANYFELLLLLLITVFSYYLMSHTFKYKNNQFVLAAKVWSDFAAHIPLIRSFSLGNNLPPEYPTFPGEAIRYHFLFYYLVALLEKLGLNIALALNLLSALGMTFLLWMIYKTTVLFFKTKKAGLLSIILFIFNGSLSFLFFIKNKKMNLSLIKQIINLENFISFGPWDDKIIAAFWNLNIYTNQRHLALSFALALILIWPLLKIVFEKKNILNKWWLLFIWISLSFFPLLHQAVYSMLVIFIFAWFLFHPKLVKTMGVAYGAAIVYSLPAFFAFPNASQISFHLGFLSVKKDLISILNYWWYNIGLYLLLIPIILIWAKKELRKFLLIFLFFFFLANSLKFSPDIINNHKLVNFFMIALEMAVAGFLVETLNKGLLKKAIVVFIIPCLIFSGVLDFFPILNDRYFYVNDYMKSKLSSWIKDHTEKDTVFLTTHYLYHQASLVGRKIFLDYGYFNWSLAYQDSERRELLSVFFAANINKRNLCSALNSSAIDYIVISPGEGDLANLNIRKSFLYRNFESISYSDNGYIIYDVKKECL
ncbi:MAG: hypothetical protein PVJ09_04515 [Candidatus Woesebacteria bacterium]|jgi:hypothetical protein